jgi:hypothetical protein
VIVLNVTIRANWNEVLIDLRAAREGKAPTGRRENTFSLLFLERSQKKKFLSKHGMNSQVDF